MLQVHRLLGRRWSLEQISVRLRNEGRLRIGATTNYRCLAGGQALGGTNWLRTQHLARRY
jgi:hypothetical protein